MLQINAKMLRSGRDIEGRGRGRFGHRNSRKTVYSPSSTNGLVTQGSYPPLPANYLVRCDRNYSGSLDVFRTKVTITAITSLALCTRVCCAHLCQQSTVVVVVKVCWFSLFHYCTINYYRSHVLINRIDTGVNNRFLNRFAYLSCLGLRPRSPCYCWWGDGGVGLGEGS